MSRLTIMLWPARVAGRIAKRVLKGVVPGESREPWAPAHPSPVSDSSTVAKRYGVDGNGAYIRPSESTDGASAESITISQLEVRERIGRKDAVVLVDVREPHEVDQGFIPGAVPIPLAHLSARFQELDPGHTVVAYCASGIRSVEATHVLRELGFPRVHSLAGGFARWVRDGGDVARAGAEVVRGQGH